MKRTAFSLFAVLLAVVLIASTAMAQKPYLVDPAKQLGYSYYPLFSGKTMTASAIDTSAAVRISAAGAVSIKTTYNDSVYVITVVDYSPDNVTYTAVKYDTLNQTGATIGTYTIREFYLRDQTANSIPGLTGWIRVRHRFQATIIGVTTPTYTTNVNWVR
jgi:hypothetical protein